jgi:type III secretion system SsaH family protein
MMPLDKEVSRLIVQAGVAAINHGLLTEANVILDALDNLVDNLEHRSLLRAVLLFGTQQEQAAWRCLDNSTSDKANVLRDLLIGKMPATLKV